MNFKIDDPYRVVSIEETTESARVTRGKVSLSGPNGRITVETNVVDTLRLFYVGQSLGVSVTFTRNDEVTLPDPVARHGGEGAHPDDAAVDRFADAMKAKLAVARAKGRGGWDGPECNARLLSDMLRDHVEKGDPRDVANFCMFLHQRGEAIWPAAPGAVNEAMVERAAVGIHESRRAYTCRGPLSEQDDGYQARVRQQARAALTAAGMGQPVHSACTTCANWRAAAEEQSQKLTAAHARIAELEAAQPAAAGVPDAEALAVAIINAAREYENPRIPFLTKDRAQHAQQINLLRDFAASLLAVAPQPEGKEEGPVTLTLRVSLSLDGESWIAEADGINYIASGTNIGEAKSNFARSLLLTLAEHVKREREPKHLLLKPDEGAAVAGVEVWINRCPYNHPRTAVCPSCEGTRPPGALHGQPIPPPPPPPPRNPKGNADA